MPPPSPSPKAGWSRFVPMQILARGGLGEVLLAQDTELKRTVALKRILGTAAADAEARRRFLLEAQITGRLEHPGVVPVYGLGTDPQTGQPSYAMRFISGVSLKDAIEAFHASSAGFDSVAFRKLLAGFLSVTQTVGFAHSKGVIHRDLKPTNVMVGAHGETLVVDWGLAKEVTAPAAAGSPAVTRKPASSLTGSATMEGAGTPGYMAPEQAAGEFEKLGPTVDIYGLGATLYHLLTGQGPLACESTLAAVSLTLTGEIPDARAVKPEVPRALAAICNKAMAHDPQQRYRSAEELGGDIERWLADEPVSCLREGVGPRVGRWIRRHPATVAASLAGVLLLGAGALGVAGLVDQQRAELDSKNIAIAEERDRALAAEKAVAEERDRARAAERAAAAEREEARALVGKCLDIARRDPAFWKAGAEDAREKLLKMAVPYHDRWARDAGGVELRRQAMLAKYESAKHAADNGKPEAIGLFRACLAELEPLAVENPTNREFRSHLTLCYNSLSQLLRASGDRSAALSALKAALAVQEKLAAETPTESAPWVMLVRSYGHLAVLQKELGNTPGAMGAYRAAIAIRLRLVSDHPGVTEYRSELARTHNTLGHLQKDTGDVKGALASYREAQTVLAKLAEENPTITSYQSDLSDAHENIAFLLSATGDTAAAIAEFRTAQAVAEKLAAEHPTLSHVRADLAKCHINLGGLYSSLGRREEAMAEFQAALAIREKLTTPRSKGTAALVDLSLSHTLVGTLLHQMGRHAEAAPSLRSAVALRERLVAKQPSKPEFRVSLAGSYNNLGNLQRDAKEYAASAASHRSAAELLAKLATEHPTVSAYRSDLAGSRFHLALSARLADDLDSAVAAGREAVVLREKLLTERPDGVNEAVLLGQYLQHLGTLEIEAGDAKSALTHTERAIEVLTGLLARLPRHAHARQFARNAHISRAELLGRANRHAEAVADWKRALELNDFANDAAMLRQRLTAAETATRRKR